MSKNKQKKLARKASSSATSNDASKRQTLAPTATHEEAQPGDESIMSIAMTSSEGPTLPIIGGGGASTASEHTRAVETQAERGRGDKGRDNTALYTPWTFLPAPVRKSLAARIAPRAWGEYVVPVVLTRNQNVKSGINKLERLFGEVGGERIVAVSAQGDATVKVVGIVEMVKRLGKGGEGEGEECFMYLGLAEMEIQRKGEDGRGKKDGEGEGEDKDEFETLEEVKGRDKKRRAYTEPVLTVWMSKTRVPGLAEAYGEQTFRVSTAKERG
ncbi:hypothetical protein BU24DRAFT_165038 [Aaosphaeria arxii CBS 175.79]|uniref:DNA/RNA-binding protein Alba-like domain-containing protein n=1 Tax=Aaosphaeria arxii CBS 175.79 TaxID=1450172 RepID=A0A6A5XXQ9_9PLEO|nr:uncharacterized protein BU24DRAFT_165038 [Aaosphaeria arxii CBS 175.79]KAF2018115.1 hypothetical protein BU24DRAFT_165038 [Aaosphaeria arxii CBS 175.79]